MRKTLLALCVAACGCSGPQLASPTSPSAALSGSAPVQARAGTALPFSGSFTRSSNADPCPPPPTFTITGTQHGNATQLGTFSASSVDHVTGTSAIGTWDFTAANGDRVFSETQGVENAFEPPNISRVTLQAKITGGSGRFANASGQFTVRFVEAINFAACSGEAWGTFDGTIDLNR